jgi:hypothetical protein
MQVASNGISFISSFVKTDIFLKSGKGKYKSLDNQITIHQFLSIRTEIRKNNDNEVRKVLCI